MLSRWAEDLDSLLDLPTKGLTRKAGNVWMERLMVFAQAYKTHPDLAASQIMKRWTTDVMAAKNIAVLGYSWNDSHINDTILAAIGRGANLVDVNPDHSRLLKFLETKFPTTWKYIQSRVFMLRARIADLLDSGTVSVSDSKHDIDIVNALNYGIPASLSVAVHPQ
jgi:hypothetical protein